MKIDDKMVDYIASLSQLELSEDERRSYGNDLSKILTYMDKLAELDTEGVSEMTHPVTTVNRFREDVVTNNDRRSELLAGAPDSKGDYFRVLKTVEE